MGLADDDSELVLAVLIAGLTKDKQEFLYRRDLGKSILP